MKRVLLTDKIAPEAERILEAFGDIETLSIGTPSNSELLEMIPEFEAVIVRSPTKLTAPVIEKADRLKFIGRAGVGVDNIDVPAATKRGIVVMNSPRSNTISTAEHTLAMMLALAREIPRANDSVVSGEWKRDSFKGVELSEKILGIIGLGRVGREVAARAVAFGMDVIAFDPIVNAADAWVAGTKMVSWEELIAYSDWITVHTPLDDSTKAMIGPTEISAMKTGVFLVNVARGGIIDENALADALDGGKVSGVALDVFEKEPPGPGHRLFKHQRAVFSPHLGGQTVDAQRRVATDVAESIGLALSRGEIRDAVNVVHGQAESDRRAD
ncbi:MAG TPA: hydroxyacid dehydrogenase [Candidatus Krumholzibacteria bacterium]|nr:hydroxyacid dehydrogenase [Candidatus Krumholzibacteria bacterium]